MNPNFSPSTLSVRARAEVIDTNAKPLIPPPSTAAGSWRRRVGRIGSKRRGAHPGDGAEQITPCRRVLVSAGPRVNDLVLRGVLPGEFSLGWVARRCEGRGVGGKPERDEQAVRLTGVGDERDDPTASAARANQNVLGEHPAQQVSRGFH